MDELIAAAKDVIAEWDDRQVVGDRKLRAAVERAESDKVDRDDALFAACMYGAKTERERIKKIVEDLQHESYDGNECFHCCQAILEMIDAPT